MIFRGKTFSQFSVRVLLAGLGLLGICVTAPAVGYAALTIEPSTWNIIGLDSNTPASGPNRFPVGAKLCGGTPGTTTTATLTWDSANPYIDLRAGSKGAPGDPITIEYGANGCADAFFEVEVQKNSNAYDTTRRYHITAGGISTPTPRELKVERLVSQGRNAITNMEFGTSLASLTSVPNGGSMDLVIGNTYYIRMSGYTATQGYEQLESFVNFPNTIFQILSVVSTYSADTSAIVSSPSDKLYADACGWDNDPLSPSYLSCYSDGKAGGNVTVTYQVRIVATTGSQQSLGSLIHDFSGSSFHYNSDFSTSARFANIIDLDDVTFKKEFTPATIAAGGTSTLTFTIQNNNYGPVSQASFIDIFPRTTDMPVGAPGDMLLANTTYSSSCGGNVTDQLGNPLSAGSSTGIKLSGGTVPAQGTCLVKINVTAPNNGTYNNKSEELFIDGHNTTLIASNDLTVSDSGFQQPQQPSSCALAERVKLAEWNMNNTTTAPPGYSSKQTNVLASKTASSYAAGGSQAIDINVPGGTPANYSWRVTDGWPVATGYYSTAPYCSGD